MKKIFLLVILVIFLTGCSIIENSKIDDIVNDVFSTQVDTLNVNRNGYRYYLPKGISVKSNRSFNEILSDQKYNYYLYVDLVSYNNKTSFIYNEKSSAYYSYKLEKNGKLGYIEINNYKNDQYLIEIMYNYAKIEVIVYESDINKAMTYAMVVLSSITYNDDVINNYLSESVNEFREKKFDIFEIVGSDNYIEFTDDDDTTEEVNDPDYID